MAYRREDYLYFDPVKLPKGVIHWSEAKEHIGENVSIYGEVVSGYFNWNEYEKNIGFPEYGFKIPPTFIGIGAEYPDPNMLQVVIWGGDRAKFNPHPETALKDKVVIISGKPYKYKDKTCVCVSSPNQIQIVEPIDDLYSHHDFQEEHFGASNIEDELTPEEKRLKPVYTIPYTPPEGDWGLTRFDYENYPPGYIGDSFYIDYRGQRCDVLSDPDGSGPIMYWDSDNDAWVDIY